MASYWSCLPPRSTFLRHARDGKALCETITRVPQPFFRPGWEGRDILVLAIRVLTNFCIVVQKARDSRQTKGEPCVGGNPGLAKGGSNHLTNCMFRDWPLPPLHPTSPTNHCGQTSWAPTRLGCGNAEANATRDARVSRSPTMNPASA